MSHKYNNLFLEEMYQKRSEWIAEKGLQEADVLEDEGGEFVYDFDESSLDDEGRISITRIKCYLPKELSRIFDFAPEADIKSHNES